MSYHRKGPGLGIGSGIGTQAMADIPEYLLFPTIPPPPKKMRARPTKALWQPTGQALWQPTGSCCAGCSKGAGCGAHDSLGAINVAGKLQLKTPAKVPTAPPTVLPSSGPSPIVTLLVLGGLAVGGVVIYRKIKNRKK